MTIAVDFDGTIVEHRYPKIGEEIPFATETLKILAKERHRLILWTVREGDLLEEAIEWCRQRGVTTATYYRLERELLTGVRKNGAPPSTAVTFAELPAPKQVSCNVAERCATLHVGEASLDIYPGCDAEQLRLLVELLRLC